jgi:hypothetical protein
MRVFHIEHGWVEVEPTFEVPGFIPGDWCVYLNDAAEQGEFVRFGVDIFETEEEAMQ